MSASVCKHNYNGWLIINKPVGISSAQAVHIVRGIFDNVKTGHAGTLDPLAEGVLPIALGEATKTISYVMTTQKSYAFTVKWGSETYTDDKEGEISRTSDVMPTQTAITDMLPKFIGFIDQVPPDYSAVKIKGKRAYMLARHRDNQNKAIKTSLCEQLKPRQIHIQKFCLTNIAGDESSFIVECGKGAYIRALARDLGRSLGSAAHITALRRLSVGKFHLDHAISLDLLEKFRHNATTFDQIIPILSALDDIPAIDITENEAQKLRFGQAILLDKSRVIDFSGSSHLDQQSVTIIAVCGELPIALVRQDAQDEQSILPIRVFNM